MNRGDRIMHIKAGEFQGKSETIVGETDTHYQFKSYAFTMEGMKPFIKEVLKEDADIVFVKGELNSCLADNIPCQHLGYKERLKDGDRDARHFSCGFGWECGRGMCARYTPDQKWVEQEQGA